MKVVIQRTTKAYVKVNGKIVGKINKGLVVLAGFNKNDNENIIDQMINKIINLRIFNDEKGVMNLSLNNIKGSILSISQFTLYADTTKGRRPSYINSLEASIAIKLYDYFNQKLKDNNIEVATGIFGEYMQVDFVNDGPITIIIDSEEWRKNNDKK